MENWLRTLMCEGYKYGYYYHPLFLHSEHPYIDGLWAKKKFSLGAPICSTHTLTYIQSVMPVEGIFVLFLNIVRIGKHLNYPMIG